MSRLQNKGYSLRPAQPAAVFPELPDLDPRLAAMPGGTETNVLLQRWWDLVRQQLASNDQQNNQRLISISDSYTSEDAVLRAAFEHEVIVRTTADESLVSEITSLTTSYQAADAILQSNITEEITSRTTADEALATDILTLTTSYQSADAVLQSNITAETTSRTTADESLAQDILELDTAYKSADSTLQANITAETTARTTAVESLASDILSLTTAYQSADSTLQSNITAEATSRSTADSTMASDISTLESSIGDLETSITTEASTRASADGAIYAHWGVRLNASNRVIGRINLDGTNGTSTLAFEADSITMWNGSSEVAPFALSGGVLELANAVVTGELDIGSGANRTNITTSGLTVGDITIDGDASSNQILIDQVYPALLRAHTGGAVVQLGSGGSASSLSDAGYLILAGIDAWHPSGSEIASGVEVNAPSFNTV